MVAMRSLVLALLSGTAWAGDVGEIERGWYHYLSADSRDALKIAAAQLRADPTFDAAHRLYISVSVSEGLDEDRDAVTREYRAWLQQDPEDPVRRTAMAHLLSLRFEYTEEPAPCEEVDALLGSPPTSADGAYHHLRVRLSLAEECSWEAAPLEQAIFALEADSESAWIWAHTTRFGRAEVTAPRVAAWLRLVAKYPPVLGDARSLWNEHPETPELRRARKQILAAALVQARSDDPAAVDAAIAILRAAEHERLEPTMAHYKVLVGQPPLDPFDEELRTAVKHPTYETRLSTLEALAAKAPPTGAPRADYEEQLAEVLRGLGREAEAEAAERRAWEADPTSWRANGLAWAAAVAGRDLEWALEIVTDAVDEQRAETGPAEGVGWEAWRVERNHNLYSYLDTRAWLLFLLARPAEALALQQEVVDRAGDDCVGCKVRLGVFLDAVGRKEDAQTLLLPALVHAEPDDVGVAEARALLSAQLPDDPIGWMPAALRLQALEVELHDSPREVRTSQAQRVGEAFPIQTFRVGGEDKTLADFAGPLVIDMWATWCGPCIAGMPHLDQLARRYEANGLRVLGISVDDKEEALQRFFGKNPGLAWTIAWYGADGFKAAGIEGIPTQFVLDAEHRIVGVVSGGGGATDDRLERMIQKGLGL